MPRLLLEAFLARASDRERDDIETGRKDFRDRGYIARLYPSKLVNACAAILPRLLVDPRPKFTALDRSPVAPPGRVPFDLEFLRGREGLVDWELSRFAPRFDDIREEDDTSAPAPAALKQATMQQLAECVAELGLHSRKDARAARATVTAALRERGLLTTAGAIDALFKRQK